MAIWKQPDATERVREAGRWIEKYAADIVGQGNGEHVSGLKVWFELENGCYTPHVHVEREHTLLDAV